MYLASLAAAFILIEVAAGEPCYVGQEHEGDSYVWKLHSQDPCACSGPLRIGGLDEGVRSSDDALYLGVNFNAEFQRITQRCPTRPAPIVATTPGNCDDKIIIAPANGVSDTFPFSPSVSVPLSFAIMSLSGSSISRDIIQLKESLTSLKYEIVISDGNVELRGPNGAQVQSPIQTSFDWRVPHDLYLDGKAMRIDSLSIHTDLPQLPLVQFISFKAENGIGAVWTISNVPCSSWL